MHSCLHRQGITLNKFLPGQKVKRYMKWNNWVLIGLGIWSVLSPWILGFSGLNLVVWNSIMVGSLVVVFAFWNLEKND